MRVWFHGSLTLYISEATFAFLFTEWKDTSQMEKLNNNVKHFSVAGPSTTTARRATPTSATTTAKGRGSAASSAPVVPFYVDLTYIPSHGDDQYSTVDFFKRVRARYYVLSALNPSLSVLNALLEGRESWNDKDVEVTLIPTYDTITLRRWMSDNRDKLAELKLQVAPSASRCSIQLQDHETSCAAYRLEF